MDVGHNVVLRLAENVLIAGGDVASAGPLARGDPFVQIALELFLQGEHERDDYDHPNIRMKLGDDLPHRALPPTGQKHADDVLAGGQDVGDHVALLHAFKSGLWIIEKLSKASQGQPFVVTGRHLR